MRPPRKMRINSLQLKLCLKCYLRGAWKLLEFSEIGEILGLFFIYLYWKKNKNKKHSSWKIRNWKWQVKNERGVDKFKRMSISLLRGWLSSSGNVGWNIGLAVIHGCGTVVKLQIAMMDSFSRASDAARGNRSPARTTGGTSSSFWHMRHLWPDISVTDRP